MSENVNGGIVMPSSSTEVNLRDIIRDRKAERKLKAEERRRNDLQRIKDMKSTTGIDPLQRFPKEVWEMVFNELDPSDRGNAYQVHPLFRDLLGKNEIRDVLLPQVFKLKEFQYSYDPDFDIENYSKLRRISRSLRNCVDQWAEDKLRKTIRSHNTVYSDGGLSSVYLDYYSLEFLKEMLACYQENNAKKKKRFFPRAVLVYFPYSLNDYEAEDEQRLRNSFKEFKDTITALLELIGDQILHFRVEFPRLTEMDPSRIIVSLDDMYILLQCWTNLTPNLQWLDLELRAVRPESLSVSSSVLEKYPFPHLLSLERVSIERVEVPGLQLMSQLWNTILGANQHVKILNLENVDDSLLRLLQTHLIRSLPLSTLSVVNSKRLNWPSLSFRIIQSLMNFNWKLEALKLELYDSKVSMNDLLKLLHNFPTLGNVSLNFMSGVKIGYNGNFEYLRLPNLTDFELQMIHPDICYHQGNSNIDFFFSLQFLLYCEKLKTLNWQMYLFDDSKLRNHLKTQELKTRGKTLDFRAGLRILYDSNVWNVFLSLCTVKVTALKLGDDQKFCYHYYKKEDVTKGMSVGEFVKVHKCCSCYNDRRLENCVVLFG